VIISAMAGALVVLLGAVAPWAEGQYDAKGIAPSPTAEAIFRLGSAVEENLWLVLLLAASLIGLLWSSFGLLDGRRPSRHDA
jgi:type II secretory pathway component PulF